MFSPITAASREGCVRDRYVCRFGPRCPWLATGFDSGMVTGVPAAWRSAAVQAARDWSILHQALCRQGRLHFETY
ncbi:hypothetical protein [Bordetella sp. H567]|uniref:hypothetical protein n=1 Tax=Bordetella sp. H567 TaxID=1697043 RepID=UPI0011AB65A8|nr:hypothetical protein [Bordetella sp. H567]